MAKRVSWANRTVVGIGFASLFSDIGHEMATAAMPALLASLGASAAVLGLIEGVADGAASFTKLASGLYSDRLEKRKPLATVGYFLTAAGMASFAIVTSAWGVLFGRVIGWLGRGVKSPVRKALLAEATTPETYGRAYGLERSMDTAGAVVGPLIAIAIATYYGPRAMFAWTIVPGMIAALLLAFAVQERPHTPKPRTARAAFAALPKPYRRFMLGIGLAGSGDFSKTLLILFAASAFTPRLGAAHAATTAMGFYVGYNVVYTVSCSVAGALADKYPKAKVLAFGYALATVPALGLLLPGDSYAKYALVFGASGLYMGFWETVESSSAAALLPADLRGTGFGVMETVNGIGDVISSAVVGTLWAFSPAAAMGFVIVTSLSGAAVIATTRDKL